VSRAGRDEPVGVARRHVAVTLRDRRERHLLVLRVAHAGLDRNAVALLPAKVALERQAPVAVVVRAALFEDRVAERARDDDVVAHLRADDAPPASASLEEEARAPRPRRERRARELCVVDRRARGEAEDDLDLALARVARPDGGNDEARRRRPGEPEDLVLGIVVGVAAHLEARERDARLGFRWDLVPVAVEPRRRGERHGAGVRLVVVVQVEADERRGADGQVDDDDLAGRDRHAAAVEDGYRGRRVGGAVGLNVARAQRERLGLAVADARAGPRRDHRRRV
jgi:hypothetical protein